MAVEVMTLGCRLNAAESESMQRLAVEAGLPSALIVNTCAVTGEAVRQARQMIRRAAREQPDRSIIVTGCAVQTEPDSFGTMPEVSLLLGNADKLDLRAWKGLATRDFGIATSEKAVVSDIMSVKQHAGHMAEAFEGQTRAFLEVQNGCDHRCTFCIIPFGRGPSRSVPPGAVVDKLRQLVDRGVAEVVLTGVDLTSYGPDLPGQPTLGTLVQAILRHVPDLPRLRLSSIDSVEVDDALIDAMESEKRLMPSLHLSLQAGSDVILKRMKRRHLTEEALAFCAMMRAKRPDIAFGADIIAGFPTETDADAEATRMHVEACGISFLHVFPFSARKGTPAARMPPVNPGLIKERAAALRDLGTKLLEKHLAGHVGRQFEVLTERGGQGRLANFTPVALPSQLPHGLLMPVKITGHNSKRLVGEPVDQTVEMAAQ
jgi:threonylcarbamoyladenosine tRNA methylthiotransferase MtaB